MKKLLFLGLVCMDPIVTYAQFPFGGDEPSFQLFFTELLFVISTVVVPFLFGLAFLFFAYNVIKYFVVGGGNKDAQEDAKNIALYSVAAFVFLTIFFGIVNMLADSIGLDSTDCTQLISDYVIENTTGPAVTGGCI